MVQNSSKAKEQRIKSISNEELGKIIKEHEVWIESKYEQGKPADLRDTDLSRRNFEGANLQEANLMGANFEGANLDGARLSLAIIKVANLNGASLKNADLFKAQLQMAELEESNLQGANLGASNLSEANLYKANLRNAQLMMASLELARLTLADLRKANLQHANLERAFLRGAQIQGADLRGANLEEADVTEIKYNRWRRYRGIRVTTCYGSARFKRFAQDQDFIEETRSHWFLFPIYLLWSISSDCGRSFVRWAGWSVLLAIFFGLMFYWLGPEAFHRTELAWEWSTMIYYSVVTFTTLGFGDVIPKTTEAAWWVMGEVIVGYVMLGGLISIFASKLARRS